jgi:carbon monoxide dehydrogenase subunit G
MARYTGTIPSRRTPAETFDYMADFTSVAEWDPSVKRAVRLDDGPVGKGSRFEVEVGFLGRTNTLTYELVEHDPATRRAVLRAEQGSMTSLDTITVAEDASVTYDAQLKLGGPARLFDPLLGLAFKRLGDNAASGLRGILSPATA